MLASLELADAPLIPSRGLLGRTSFEGALLVRPARWVHTFGRGFAMDVAHLDAEMRVLRTERMNRFRLGRVVRGARAVLEADAGSFERWGLVVGDELAIRSGNGPKSADRWASR